jgi:hypothetical protein
MDDHITLILASPRPAADTADRMGGETHGIITKALGKATIDVSAEEFKSQLEKVIGLVQTVAARLKAQVADYTADEITIGLAVSAEGSVGIATAGVEASIHVNLKRHS